MTFVSALGSVSALGAVKRLRAGTGWRLAMRIQGSNTHEDQVRQLLVTQLDSIRPESLDDRARCLKSEGSAKPSQISAELVTVNSPPSLIRALVAPSASGESSTDGSVLSKVPDHGRGGVACIAIGGKCPRSAAHVSMCYRYFALQLEPC